MRAADVGAVARIERATFVAEAWPRSAFAYLHAVFVATRPPRGRLWVAEAPGRRIVGYVGVELSALGGEADVINLAVDTVHRRRGVGRRLLDTAVAHCRARRIPLVWLRVRAGNRGARRFYRACGFEAAGRFRDYYDDPPEDAVLMTLDA
jgi:[ribosomal protein S18]-alanine N-acetyltransferase